MWKTFEIGGFSANRKGAEKIKRGDSVKKIGEKGLKLAWNMGKRPEYTECFVIRNSMCHL